MYDIRFHVKKRGAYNYLDIFLIVILWLQCEPKRQHSESALHVKGGNTPEI
ncbi:Uncharacterized protein dnm_015370 [Desulfonema magnum]|uniref:Uncharacterized protein n=1 Tax=Desulfonema magnum TaxID=45655 RepID=A0A975GL68_9BACT|nr:Uncharacterized protein dnm_015370 [Desulfonema magnum]